MKAIILLCSFAVCFLMAGCSPSIPADADGKAVIAEKIQTQSNGLIRLVSFEKTNGLAMEVMGVKTYRMQYEAQIEFLDDCLWSSGGFMGWQGNFAASRARPGMPAIDFSATRAKKGQRLKVAGEFVFQQTEQGWRLAH